MGKELTAPDTRIEKYLAAIAGKYTGKLPEPISCIDQYLKIIAENFAGGTSGGVAFEANQNTSPLAHAGGLHCTDSDTGADTVPDLLDNLPLSYYTTGITGSDPAGDFGLDDNNRLRLHNAFILFSIGSNISGAISRTTPIFEDINVMLEPWHMPAWFDRCKENPASIPIATSVQSTSDDAAKLLIYPRIKEWDTESQVLVIRYSVLAVGDTDITIPADSPVHFTFTGFAYNVDAINRVGYNPVYTKK